MIFITIKDNDQTVRVYETEEEATKQSIKINQSDPFHPSFQLFQYDGINPKAKWIGRLIRDFGNSKLYWG